MSQQECRADIEVQYVETSRSVIPRDYITEWRAPPVRRLPAVRVRELCERPDEQVGGQRVRVHAPEPAPRTIRGARDLLSVALQYGNAFGQGMQAAALKPADHFGDDDVLYLMEDMATGEIRLSILWEWLHKGAALTDGDPDLGLDAGTRFDAALFARLLDEEYGKLLAAADRDVHEDSKTTTLPIAREIADTYVGSPIKAPWYIDLLNLNLDNHDLDEARERIRRYVKEFSRDGTRVTENLDFA